MNAPVLIQGSDAWKVARLGKVTASRMSDLMAKTKSGWAASRANLAAELIAARLTGVPGDTYTNAAMQFGIDTEPQGRTRYEFIRDVTVEQVGFVPHPSIPMAGASPDGMVGTDGLVEIKCPNTATHIATLLEDSIPGKYILQMQWQMACTGRAWCDYLSFDPRMPPSMQMFLKRVPRDQSHIATLEREVSLFLAEVAVTVATLQEKYEARKAA